MPNYQELKMNTIDSLKERIEDLWIEEIDNIAEIIHEETENWIPVYNYDILQIALSDLNLVCYKSDLWPAYWQDYPINRIISNIYDRLSEDLFEWYNAKYE